MLLMLFFNLREDVAHLIEQRVLVVVVNHLVPVFNYEFFFSKF